MRSVGEFAGKLVCPLMVGAYKLRYDGQATIQQARASMAADIVNNRDFSVVITEEDEAGVSNVDHGGVARLRHVAFQPHIYPMLLEKDVQVRPKDILASVKALREGVSIESRVKKIGDGGWKLV
jgi:hypothetical protein